MERVKRLSAHLTASSTPFEEEQEEELSILPSLPRQADPVVQDMFGPLQTGLSPDFRPIKFDPATADMVPGGLMDGLAADQQRTHEYYKDETGQVSAGLWEVKGTVSGIKVPTADRTVYLMLLPLTNALVTVRNMDTDQDVGAMAGEAIVIPRGTNCEWHQEEGAFVMIGYVSFTPTATEPLSKDAQKKPPAAKSLSLDMLTDDTELKEMKDTSRYIDEVPTHHIKGGHGDATRQFSCGLWDAGPAMHTKPLPFPGNPPCPQGQIEYSCILQGECCIRNGDGVDTHIKAGESYLVPRGMSYEWHSDEYVAKIACNFRPRV